MNHDAEYFDYPALSDEQIGATRGLIPEGNYPFETLSAESKTSKAGNKMAQLKQKLWDANGAEYVRTDWLIGTETMAWKTKHYWESVGKPERYKGKNLLSDFPGNCGVCEIKHQKDQNGKIQERINDYLPPTPESMKLSIKDAEANAIKQTKETFDDDIPF